jgi:hypothetical protein
MAYGPNPPALTFEGCPIGNKKRSLPPGTPLELFTPAVSSLDYPTASSIRARCNDKLDGTKDSLSSAARTTTTR